MTHEGKAAQASSRTYQVAIFSVWYEREYVVHRTARELTVTLLAIEQETDEYLVSVTPEV